MDVFRDGLPELPCAEGTHLLLRAMRESDAAAVYRLYCDREAVRFGYAPKMDDLEDARRVIAECRALAQARTIFHWGVARRDPGRDVDEIVGHATLFKV